MKPKLLGFMKHYYTVFSLNEDMLLVSVLISGSVERFSLSRMRDFSLLTSKFKIDASDDIGLDPFSNVWAQRICGLYSLICYANNWFQLFLFTFGTK